MIKMNSKRALLMSALSLLLCASMLIGTTFAWFTDSVTSTNNIIKAGNLDVELYWSTDAAAWEPVTNTTNVFTNQLWEPGHTEVVYLKVKNAGTLELKYNLGVNIYSETTGINMAGDIFKLSDYINFGVVETNAKYADRDAAVKAAGLMTPISRPFSQAGTLAPAAEKTVAMVVHMPTTVGNEANYKTGTNAPVINLGINLFATQTPAEVDSYGPDYDESAAWAGGVDTKWYDDTKTEFTLTTPEQLAGLAELVNGGNTFAGKTIKLGADLDLRNLPWTPIGTKSAEGEKAFSRTFAGSFDGQDHTIYNLYVSGGNALGLFGRTGTGTHIEDLKIVNAYVSGEDYVGAIAGYAYLSANCIKNCTVENATIIATPYKLGNGEYDGGAKAGVIVGYALNGNLVGNTVKNSTVSAYRDLGAIAGMLNSDGIGDRTLVASSNTVEGVTLSYVGAPGKYADGKENGNMNDFVGRCGAKASVAADNRGEANKNEDNKGVTVLYTLEELIAFAKDVNNGNTYAGKTVILGDHIDLCNMEWTPIGTGAGFCGIFDGNGKTISNLKITGNKSTVGLFANTYNGEIKNLTVKNAMVSGRLNVGVVAGNPYTSKYTNITVKGHVEVNGFSYVGGVGGKNAYADWTDITVKVDETSYVKAISTENGKSYRTYVGGVVGFNGEGGHSFTNITSNINVIGDVCDIGGAFGIAHYGNKFENVTITGNVTSLGEADEIGGIAGVWNNTTGYTVTFTNCKFTGKITADEAVTGCDFVGGAYSASGTGELIITNFVMENGIEYALDGVSGDKTLYLVPADYEGDTVNVAEGTVAIGGYAFAYNSNIETIVLPSTVKTLNDRAFRDTSASVVVLNEGLENISWQAFRNAANVKSVVIPSTVKTISKEAFQNSGITTLAIPATVETLEYGACRDMKELVSVVIEGNVEIPVYAFRACTKLESVTLTGDNVTFAGKGMIFTNTENGDGSAITMTVANDVIKARVLAADTAAKDYGGYTINTKQTAAEGGYYVDANGNATAYDAPALDAALNAGKNVSLSGDLKFNASETTANSGYGATGVSVKGGVLDGNGHKLGINNWGTWDSAINITSGTIKNLTVNSGMRGIFINHNGVAGKVILENVIIDGTVYTISCDQGSNSGLEATNCTFNGWTSYAATTGDVKFNDCSFGAGQGYAYCRPYAPTAFVGCDFAAGYELEACAAVTFENCTIGGVALTAENLSTLVIGGINNATVK